MSDKLPMLFCKRNFKSIVAVAYVKNKEEYMEITRRNMDKLYPNGVSAFDFVCLQLMMGPLYENIVSDDGIQFVDKAWHQLNINGEISFIYTRSFKHSLAVIAFKTALKEHPEEKDENFVVPIPLHKILEKYDCSYKFKISPIDLSKYEVLI
jgi:hypothetical protein